MGGKRIIFPRIPAMSTNKSNIERFVRKIFVKKENEEKGKRREKKEKLII